MTIAKISLHWILKNGNTINNEDRVACVYLRMARLGVKSGMKTE